MASLAQSTSVDGSWFVDEPGPLRQLPALSTCEPMGPQPDICPQGAAAKSSTQGGGTSAAATSWLSCGHRAGIVRSATLDVDDVVEGRDQEVDELVVCLL